MPLGAIRDPAPTPLRVRWGTPNMGGLDQYDGYRYCEIFLIGGDALTRSTRKHYSPPVIRISEKLTPM